MERARAGMRAIRSGVSLRAGRSRNGLTACALMALLLVYLAWPQFRGHPRHAGTALQEGFRDLVPLWEPPAPSESVGSPLAHLKLPGGPGFKCRRNLYVFLPMFGLGNFLQVRAIISFECVEADRCEGIPCFPHGSLPYTQVAAKPAHGPHSSRTSMALPHARSAGGYLISSRP